MIEATPSYRCKVSKSNSRATLRLGWRRFRVEVIEMSRDSFFVSVPSSLARRISVGTKTKFHYQEMLWSVLCSHKWIGNSDKVELEFQQLAELTPPRVANQKMWGTSKQVRTLSDSTLPVAVTAGMIVAILILPAWGGAWGTSDAICSAVNSTWTALGQLVTGRR
jgi:hypothetical protein